MNITNKELFPYLEQLLATKKETVKISFSQDKPNILDCMLGGSPYWEANKQYPLDKNNNPMFFLAQLNFSLLPHLKDFPKNGILQFFISASDELFGLDFDDQTNQTNFRIVFWNSPSLEKYVASQISNLSFSPDKHMLPFFSNIKLSGLLKNDYWGTHDEYVGNSLKNINEEQKDDIEDSIYSEEELTCGGHKIGGYAFFTQSDPRPYLKNAEDKSFNDTDNPWLLLLQLDSETASWDKSIELIWGDVGVANFFIRKNDLLNLDFSKVLYNWDCY